MIARMPYRRLMIALAVAALVAAGAGVALAHAKLKSSIPAAGSTVATAPATVTTVFDNHDALTDASSLKVTDASGAAVDKGDSALAKSDPDRKTLTVSLNEGLGNGTYTVTWTAVSSGDGSTATESFSFTVGAATTGAPATLPITGGADMPVAAWIGGAVALVALGLLARRRVTR
jgi:LPXTG-motif cell wall-anchored protein